MSTNTTREYDLTHKLSEYLDLHLILPLLDFLETCEVYPADEVKAAKLEIIQTTNMLDYAIEIYKELHKGAKVPADLEERRDLVFSRLEILKEQAHGLILALEDSAFVERMSSEGRFTWDAIRAERSLDQGALEAFHDFAKFNYECGDYTTAEAALAAYLQLTGGASASAGGSTSAKSVSALWGRLACLILGNNDEDQTKIIPVCTSIIHEAKALIEHRGQPSTPLQQLQQRSWLMHWSLFIFFNHPNGRDDLISLFFEEKFMQAIQSNCPWLLRYLVTAVILSRASPLSSGSGSSTTGQKRNILRDLIRCVEQEKESYADPIIQFLEALYVRFDFDAALERHAACEAVLQGDFFLRNVCDEFMEGARLLIFETYCRIHNKLDISMLASKMGIQNETAEKWVVDLIHGSQLDAKIDSCSNQVIMQAKYPSVYEQVIDKTKDLNVRSHLLINNLSQYAQDKRNGLTEGPNYNQSRAQYKMRKDNRDGGYSRD